jgi:alpha-ribazole phosphatase
VSFALVRHPEPNIAPGLCYGRLDIAAKPAPDSVLDPLAGFAARIVWSSPARRCLPLAERIAAILCVPLHQDPRLLEMDFGNWEGRAWDDIDRAALDAWAAAPLDFVPPGGESASKVVARVSAFHADLRRDAQSAVIVAHAGPLKVLAALLRGEPIDALAASQPFASVRIIGPSPSP